MCGTALAWMTRSPVNVQERARILRASRLFRPSDLHLFRLYLTLPQDHSSTDTMRSFDVRSDASLKNDNLAVGFLKVHPLVPERPDVDVDGIEGPAAELIRLCPLLATCKEGNMVLQGRFQCQLGEQQKPGSDKPRQACRFEARADAP